MLVTVINKYHSRSAESFTAVVRGVLTLEQRKEWRKTHECDDYDPDPEDGCCPNNMTFRVIDMDKLEPFEMLNIDGEDEIEPPVKLTELRRYVKVDCSELDAAAQEDSMGGTTYYAGMIFIGNKTNVDIQIPCGGNDRGDDLVYYPTMEAVADALGLIAVEEWNDEVSELFMQHIGPGAEFLVAVDDGKLLFMPTGGELTSCSVPSQ